MGEVVPLLGLLLLYQLDDELEEVVPPVLREQGLGLHNLVHEGLDVGSRPEVEEVQGALVLVTSLLVKEDHSRRVVPKQELLQLQPLALLLSAPSAPMRERRLSLPRSSLSSVGAAPFF